MILVYWSSYSAKNNGLCRAIKIYFLGGWPHGYCMITVVRLAMLHYESYILHNTHTLQNYINHLIGVLNTYNLQVDLVFR